MAKPKSRVILIAFLIFFSAVTVLALFPHEHTAKGAYGSVSDKCHLCQWSQNYKSDLPVLICVETAQSIGLLSFSFHDNPESEPFLKLLASRSPPQPL